MCRSVPGHGRRSGCGCSAAGRSGRLVRHRRARIGWLRPDRYASDRDGPVVVATSGARVEVKGGGDAPVRLSFFDGDGRRLLGTPPPEASRARTWWTPPPASVDNESASSYSAAAPATRTTSTSTAWAKAAAPAGPPGHLAFVLEQPGRARAWRGFRRAAARRHRARAARTASSSTPRRRRGWIRPVVAAARPSRYEADAPTLDLYFLGRTAPRRRPRSVRRA